MQYQTITRSAVTAGVLGAAVAAADEKSTNKTALDNAFAALKTFDWGGSDNKVREVLGAIEDAVPAATPTRPCARNWKPGWPRCCRARPLARRKTMSAAS